MDRELHQESAMPIGGNEGSGGSARLALFAASRPRITEYLGSWHNTQDFSCPVPRNQDNQPYVNEVVSFLRNDALRWSNGGNGHTFVYAPPTDLKSVHGFYHLSPSKLDSKEIDNDPQTATKYFGPISVKNITWLGRHAVTEPKLGKALIYDAALRAAEGRDVTGLTLTAATKRLISYYQDNGFRLCSRGVKRLEKNEDTDFLMYGHLTVILGAT